MTEPFTLRIVVRGYELDTQGHLNQAVYLQYCEHLRWESMRAAGISQAALIDTGVGPAALEQTMRFHRELRGGDEVDVTCSWVWGEGKTFRMEQEIRRADGVLACEVSCVAGLLDLEKRKLLPNPAEYFAKLAEHPEIMGL
ncbi:MULTISPECIES: acyl-CoA thioesterase [Streptomyces]|uniref:Thioesterase family protein n=1 Tax=Streptomyces solicathayae TaxID=3081768 RepID=A0ABZ0LMD1_9ACTN|nr:thioesterase family protein [Streptomyces sp. HUAS YS2]WOX20652.1 thioesterase family protein [Streptomyces sp. HUAS YS2]